VRDEALPALLAELGLPGIVDVHVHAMPDRLMAAVWDVFDRAEQVYGTAWPVLYRWSDDRRRKYLAAIGVARHSTLCYAHRPGMAVGLNHWTGEYARRYPQVLHSATFYPEPGAAGYVAEALSGGAKIFKIHVEVGNFDVNDPLLDGVWAMLSDAEVPVVAHIGSAPLPSPFSGPAFLERLLARFGRLQVIVAHFGVPEVEVFLDLADRYDGVALDTTMVGTDFMNRRWTVEAALLPRIAELGLAGRVFFGSDFPNIPYPYAHQVEALRRWDLGDDWLRTVLWEAGARRFAADAGDARPS
jgi:uncharacterized protein